VSAIVIDTSALIGPLLQESDAESLLVAAARAAVVRFSATRLQPADPLNQAGVHSSGHGLAIPLDHNAVQDDPVGPAEPVRMQHTTEREREIATVAGGEAEISAAGGGQGVGGAAPIPGRWRR
jgi:hypothetical protein